MRLTHLVHNISICRTYVRPSGNRYLLRGIHLVCELVDACCNVRQRTLNLVRRHQHKTLIEQQKLTALHTNTIRLSGMLRNLSSTFFALFMRASRGLLNQYFAIKV